MANLYKLTQINNQVIPNQDAGINAISINDNESTYTITSRMNEMDEEKLHLIFNKGSKDKAISFSNIASYPIASSTRLIIGSDGSYKKLITDFTRAKYTYRITLNNGELSLIFIDKKGNITPLANMLLPQPISNEVLENSYEKLIYEILNRNISTNFYKTPFFISYSPLKLIEERVTAILSYLQQLINTTPNDKGHVDDSTKNYLEELLKAYQKSGALMRIRTNQEES